MHPVDQFETEGTTLVVLAKDQAEYVPLPALLYPDGKVLTEWSFTEDERAMVARGENLRLWVWVFPQRCGRCGHAQAGKLQPVLLELTDERKG